MTKPVIGFVGLGKLGTPLAVAIASRGYKVVGYDADPNLVKRGGIWPHKECGPDGITPNFQTYFDQADLTYLELPEVLQQADIVFITVQTPHGPEYEGITRLPRTRADFDYRHLIEACAQVAKHCHRAQTLVVVSTVLPGTLRQHILPLLPECVYNPAFPAMGTVLRDFLYPEFVLMGSDHPPALQALESFYCQLYGSTEHLHEEGPPVPICQVSIESAELTKVAYNLFISFKIAYANNLMEIAHKTRFCDIDEVSRALSLADRRLLSAAYLKGGMGDGGGCHPRDAIAMSWLAEQRKLSCNMFDDLMLVREWQTEWLANLFCVHGHDMPKVILGKSYKPESALTTGSPALLLAHILKERKKEEFIHWDPYVDGHILLLQEPTAFFVATQHEAFKTYPFPQGSVVVDPFRYIPTRKGITVVPVGKGR